MNCPISTYSQTTSNSALNGAEILVDSTGKEKDYESGYHYFGARYYDSEVLAGWLSVDPMADKYPSISSYAYCAWNPVKLVDPDGKEIDPTCIDNWNAKKKAIQDRRGEIHSQIEQLRDNNSFFGQYFRNKKIEKLNDRIVCLDGTLTSMCDLERDESTTYTLSNIDKNGRVRLILKGAKKGMISIESSSISSFVHEVTHAGQYYDNDIGFFTGNGAIAAYDIFDEVAAYKAALAYNPKSYDNRYMEVWQVTPEWVRPRSKTYSSCGTIPVTIFSSATQINSSGISNLGQYHNYLEIPSDLLMYRH